MRGCFVGISMLYTISFFSANSIWMVGGRYLSQYS